jgi:hypothetical protein
MVAFYVRPVKIVPSAGTKDLLLKGQVWFSTYFVLSDGTRASQGKLTDSTPLDVTVQHSHHAYGGPF